MQSDFVRLIPVGNTEHDLMKQSWGPNSASLRKQFGEGKGFLAGKEKKQQQNAKCGAVSDFKEASADSSVWIIVE